MHYPQVEMTAEDVIGFVVGQGYDVSRHQLVRWHKAGLLPRPRRKHLGRGKGTVSLYPATAALQTVALASARQRYRDLDAMAWFAWSLGFPVTSRIRAMLLAWLTAQEQALRDALTQFENEEPDNPIDRAATEPSPKGFRHVPPAFRPTVARILAEVQLGEFEKSVNYDESDFRPFVSSFRQVLHGKSRRDKAASMRESLTALSREIPLPRVRDAVTRMSDDRLEQLRNRTLHVWGVLDKIADGKLGPMPFGAFFVVLTLTHVSPFGRWLVRFFKQAAAESPYGSIEAAFLAASSKRQV